MTKAVDEVLIGAIGEEAAEKALNALHLEAESIRGDRPNIRVIIVFEHGGEPEWGKLVTRFTRAPHDKLDFND
jgi:hypothetical protein